MSNHLLLFFWLFLLIVFVPMYWRASRISVCRFAGHFVVAHICGHNGAADANNQVEKCSVWILKHLLKAYATPLWVAIMKLCGEIAEVLK